MSDNILEIKNVSKAFPGVKALSDISFCVRRGEVHGLIGENGAGKSTLMKILNGNHRMDSGEIILDGKQVNINNPIEAREKGISIIFQELNLVPTLSITENIFLSRLPKKKGLVDWKTAHAKAKECLQKIGYTMDPKTIVGGLSTAQKQMVEIAKAISFEETKIVLMDEPTSSLTNKESDALFEVIKELKANGIAVIYISHKLEEVMEVCDTVTIIRDGHVISSQSIETLSKEKITTMMIGRELSEIYPTRKKKPSDEEILRVEHLSRKGILNDISFSLNKGEILGVAGLVGAGRTEMARAIFGVDYKDSGDIYIKGEKINILNPQDAIKKGICYLSEERKVDGLVGCYSVNWNISIANLSSVSNSIFLSSKKEKKLAEDSVNKLNIKTPSIEQTVFNLSGGNQQKIVVAKWLNTDTEVYIFDEPTRGIDIGAKYEIYVLLTMLADEGKGVIFISSELPEILGISDRVMVVRNGEISKILEKADMSAQAFIDNAI